MPHETVSPAHRLVFPRHAAQSGKCPISFAILRRLALGVLGLQPRSGANRPAEAAERRKKSLMSEHYTRLTQSVTAWCKKCANLTMHRVDDRRKGPCLVCIAKLESEHALKSKRVEAVQESLFQN
jgi:hypothetical protein